jgi:hypothetical protein
MSKIVLGVAGLSLLTIQMMAQHRESSISSSGRRTIPELYVQPPNPPNAKKEITGTKRPLIIITIPDNTANPSIADAVASAQANFNTEERTVVVNGKAITKSRRALQEQADEPMKTKMFSKSFSIGRNDKINLLNVYGSITIKTWNKNEIKVDADIKAYANTDDAAQKLLDNVDIRAAKEGDQVTFKTNIGERSGNWGRGSLNGRKWRREVKVYLTVYMPRENALNVSQEHGHILLDDYNGPTSIKVQYGSIVGGDLNNINNYISAEYASTKFNSINQAKVRLEYGNGLTIGEINSIDLDAQFAKVNINTIKNSGNIRMEYGSGINIGNANNLTLNSHFIRTKIINLTGNTAAKLEYGGLSVENVGIGVKNFNVKSEYASINLGFDAEYRANFNVSTDYAGFKFGAGITAKKLGDDKGYSSSKSYSGQIGKGGVNNILIKAEYGSVTFK